MTDLTFHMQKLHSTVKSMLTEQIGFKVIFEAPISIVYCNKQGNAGLGLSVLIIVMTATVALVAVLSAIGVCERCNMESGGVYFLIGHVLGARTSAAVGIIYCFGQVNFPNLTFFSYSGGF